MHDLKIAEHELRIANHFTCINFYIGHPFKLKCGFVYIVTKNLK